MASIVYRDIIAIFIKSLATSRYVKNSKTTYRETYAHPGGDYKQMDTNVQKTIVLGGVLRTCTHHLDAAAQLGQVQLRFMA